MTNTQPNSFDLGLELASMGLPVETNNTTEPLSQIDSIFTGEENIQFVTGQEKNLAIKDIGSESQNFDFLNYIDTEIQTIESNEVKNSIESEKKHEVTPSFFSSKTKERIKFGFHYISATSIVFGILLVATNWSAYSAIAHNYFNPSDLQNASSKIETTLSQSKITVYANEDTNTLHSTELSIKADEIKSQLHAEDQTIEEDPFKIQSLIPTKPSVSASFEITPYENRIIIPKIGKNIPLVDIVGESSFDFDHMENIFMQELEKGVVRYPGTALPGQTGNSFIFGHSSNYPWMKGNYNDVFALIDHLEFGDKIIVYYNQKKFIYTIREKKIIKPGDVKALERDSNKTELSLMTCWPIGTTLKRMLVFAELTNE